MLEDLACVHHGCAGVGQWHGGDVAAHSEQAVGNCGAERGRGGVDSDVAVALCCDVGRHQPAAACEIDEHAVSPRRCGHKGRTCPGDPGEHRE